MENRSGFQIGRFSLSYTNLAVLVSFIIALQNGFNHGMWNHNTYLLKGLHLFQPELFTRDWLATETSHYHPLFARISVLFYMISQDGWMFGIANLLSVFTTVFFISKIIYLVFKDSYPHFVLLLTASCLAITETYSLGGSYIYSPTFQPSSIGALCFIVGVYYFFLRKYLLTGIILALGGLFHVNYLILSIPLFGFSMLLHYEKGQLKEILRLLIPMLIATAYHLPNLLGASSGTDAGIAREIFQQIISPQHYYPISYLDEFLAFYSWHILAIVIGWRYLSSNDINKRFKLFFILNVAFVTFASLLTTIVFVPVVSQLYVWRLAPYSVLFCFILGSHGIVQRLFDTKEFNVNIKSIFMFLLYGGMIALVWYNHYGNFRLQILRLLLFIGIVTLLFYWGNKFRRFEKEKRYLYISIFFVISFLYGGIYPFKNLHLHNNLITGLPQEETKLFDWVSKESSVDALFLIPPNFQNFRLNAKRSVVIDWKSTPVVADELLEWYQRIRDVTNLAEVTSRSQITPAYNLHTGKSLKEVYNKYSCDYVVVRSEADVESYSDFICLYQNEKYIVLSLIIQE